VRLFLGKTRIGNSCSVSIRSESTRRSPESTRLSYRSRAAIPARCRWLGLFLSPFRSTFAYAKDCARMRSDGGTLLCPGSLDAKRSPA
jgi:hypothetical protein